MKLILGFLSLSLLLTLGTAKADWTDQFIGTINFNLSEDPDYANYYHAVKNSELRLSQWRNASEERKRHLDQASKNRHAKNAELQKAKQHLANKNQQALDAGTQITTLAQQIPNFQSRISQLESDNDRLSSEISGHKAELQRLENELAQTAGVEAERAKIQAKINDISRQISGLNQQVSNNNSEISKLQSSISANDKQFSVLGKQIETTMSEVQALEVTITRLEGDIERYNNELAQAEKDLSVAMTKEEAIKIQAKIDQLKRGIGTATSKMNGAKAEVEKKMSGVADIQNKMAELKIQNAAAEKKISGLETQNTNLQSTIASHQSTIRDLERELSATAGVAAERAKLKVAIDQIKTTIAGKSTKISENNGEITKNENELQNTTKKIAELKTLIATINNEVPQIQNNINRLAKELQEATQIEQNLVQALKEAMAAVAATEFELQTNINNLNSYTNQLIAEIISFNRTGFERATYDGAREGQDIAARLGASSGQYDGNQNGLARGEADGRARDYAAGAQVGDQKSSVDGARDGQKVGHADGIVAGNRAAGRSAGAANGVRRAEASDARQVGERQGTQAGYEKAQADGKVQGHKLGEKEAIETNEGATKEEKSINGQFAGTFASGIPNFPGTQGTYFNNQVSANRRLLQLAYTAGYNYGYNPSAEKAYYEKVRSHYDQAYNSAYNYAYNQAYNVSYDDSRRQGEADQYRVAYKREYDRAYDLAFDKSYDVTYASPNMAGSDYQSSYKSADAEYYASHYEVLRKASYDASYAASYQQHIAEQVAKFKAERMDQVNKLYAAHPVLRFVSESIWDAGTREVGVKDDVYMPGESVGHDVTIINYSGAAASNVEVRINETNSVILPSIPGKTVLTIKGAALHRLSPDLAVGTNAVSNLSVRYTLTSAEKNIQGRYFQSQADSLLARAKAQTVRIAYPIQVQNPVAQTSVYHRQDVKLRVNISNTSKRALRDVTLKLDTTLGTKVIAREFAVVPTLEKVATLEDAVINVKDEADLFSTIAFKVNVYSNGVFLGASVMGGEEIVRAGFEDKPGKPVVLFSSTSKASREAFQELMNEAGGVSQISVIDLNGPASNAQVLASKMTGKTILAILDAEGKVLPSLNLTFKLDRVLVAFLEGNDSNLVTARNSLSTLRDSTILPFEFRGQKFSILTSSPLFNEEVKAKNSVINFELRDLELVNSLASILKLSDDDLLQTLTQNFTMEKFLSKSEDMILINKVLGLRAIEDIMQVSSAYEDMQDKHNKKVLRKMFKNENDLLLRKFRNKFEKGSPEERLAASTAAYPLQHGINFLMDERDPFQSLLPRIRRNVKWSIRDFDNDARKYIKKNVNKGAVKQIEAIESSYFVIQ